MKKRTQKHEDGQALVEFALVLPILLVLLCAIIDFSWMYYNQITISNAAREGARYAVVNCGTKPNWKHETETRMLDDMVGVDSATVVVSDPVGQQITASVTASPRILTGFTSTILGRNTIELHADCTMRIEH